MQFEHIHILNFIKFKPELSGHSIMDNVLWKVQFEKLCCEPVQFEKWVMDGVCVDVYVGSYRWWAHDHDLLKQLTIYKNNIEMKNTLI